MNDGLIQPLQQDDEVIGVRSLPCARTRPGKSSGDAPTSAAPIAVLRLIMALLSISFLLPLIPGSGWSRATAAARKRAWRRKGHYNVAGLPQEGVWARLDPLNGRRYALVPDVSNTAGTASREERAATDREACSPDCRSRPALTKSLTSAPRCHASRAGSIQNGKAPITGAFLLMGGAGLEPATTCV